MDLEKLKSELRLDEGFRRYPYHCTAGKITIGIGRNIEDVGISEDEAEYLLNNDIQMCVSWLDKEYPWFEDLTDARQRALVNMLFNLGISRFTGFKKMIRAFAIGHYDRAAIEAMDSKWFFQVGERADRIIKMIKEG